jgi:transcriptional regulator with XRE-family HTH domain
MSERERDAHLIALGRALRELRIQAGLTQEQLAERLDMHAAYVSRLERGHRGAQWLTVQRFLTALGADLHQLANAIDDAERKS